MAYDDDKSELGTTCRYFSCNSRIDGHQASADGSERSSEISGSPQADQVYIPLSSLQNSISYAIQDEDGMFRLLVPAGTVLSAAGLIVLPKLSGPMRDGVKASKHRKEKQQSTKVVQTGPKVSSKPPGPSKKSYCTYWLHKGTCQFISQGCKYLHVIPRDLDILESLGLHELPGWFMKSLSPEDRALEKQNLEYVRCQKETMAQRDSVSDESLECSANESSSQPIHSTTGEKIHAKEPVNTVGGHEKIQSGLYQEDYRLIDPRRLSDPVDSLYGDFLPLMLNNASVSDNMPLYYSLMDRIMAVAEAVAVTNRSAGSQWRRSISEDT